MTKKSTKRLVISPGREANPTSPGTPIVILGKVYRLLLNYRALAKAESELRALGHDVNLLFALPSLNLTNTRILFAAGLRAYHPEIAFEDGLNLLPLGKAVEVANAIADALLVSVEKGEDTENPT